MGLPAKSDLMAGVIEGFYGEPWSQPERLELFDSMCEWGLNTYLYAPKDDVKHRALWREPYTNAEAEALRELIRACQSREIQFIYALAPGLDIHYASEIDSTHVKTRLEQLLALGCNHFALLFDDIPDRMPPADNARFGSFASAQAHLANSIFRWARQHSPHGRFLFCPTPYCGRMAEQHLGGKEYLPTLGGELLPDIDVFWTGPEIISREIPVAHIHEVQSVLRRKPVIWDNLHANDYDGRRFYCGPYAGRAPELQQEVRGFLSNANNEFRLNYVPWRTLAQFVRFEPAWNARGAYIAALQEWLARFATIRTSISLEDLILFGDCFYLPHSEGAEAEELYAAARALVLGNGAHREADVAAFRDRASRLRAFCARATELRDRQLFYALSRRIWDLREELDLLERYISYRAESPDPARPFTSDFHLPGTYRGGMVARLQRLLVQQQDGSFTPTSS